MWQFLQTYGIWILIGIFFVLMMRMHGGGMHGRGMGGGCGMGMDHDEHDQHDQHSNGQRVVPLDNEHTDAQRVVPLDGYTNEPQVMSPNVGYSDADRKALVGGEYTAAGRVSLAREGTGEEEKVVADGYSSRRHSHGC